MADSGSTSKTWVIVITIAAPVLSAIIVAVISQQTNIRLAELERAAKADAVQIEQSKLREQQEARRQQFMENNLPKLLSEKEAERQVGKALLFVNYPNEASDVLNLVMPAASSTVQASLAQVQKEAQAAQQATGNWTVVITGEKTLDLAKKWFSTSQSLGYAPVSIFYRDGLYRVTVGNYPTRQLAEQAAVAIRPQTRPDAYVVALGRWCPLQSPRKEGDLEIIACGSG
jgi:hypothetical protein